MKVLQVNSQDITVTNHRLKEAIRVANEKSMKITSKELGKTVEKTNHISKGIIEKYFFTDEAEVKLDNGKTVHCTMLHDYADSERIISISPTGATEETYIIPNERLEVLVVGIKDEYYILGFLNNNKLNLSSDGEILIECGEYKISMTDERLNIIAENFFINGLPYDVVMEDIGNANYVTEDWVKQYVDSRLGSVE